MVFPDSVYDKVHWIRYRDTITAASSYDSDVPYEWTTNIWESNDTHLILLSSVQYVFQYIRSRIGKATWCYRMNDEGRHKQL